MSKRVVKTAELARLAELVARHPAGVAIDSFSRAIDRLTRLTIESAEKAELNFLYAGSCLRKAANP